MFTYCHTVEQPATDAEGRCIVVLFDGGRSVTVGWDQECTGDVEEHHRTAARGAANSLGEGRFTACKAEEFGTGFRFDLVQVVDDTELTALLDAVMPAEERVVVVAYDVIVNVYGADQEEAAAVVYTAAIGSNLDASVYRFPVSIWPSVRDRLPVEAQVNDHRKVAA